MKLIIAGSRSITDPWVVPLALMKTPIRVALISEVVSGQAPGIDTLGERWALVAGKPVAPFPALWGEVEGKPPHLVKRNRSGQLYYVLAGHERNQRMADYADELLAIWDGKSTGTADMIGRMDRLGKPVHTYLHP